MGRSGVEDVAGALGEVGLVVMQRDTLLWSGEGVRRAHAL